MITLRTRRVADAVNGFAGLVMKKWIIRIYSVFIEMVIKNVAIVTNLSVFLVKINKRVYKNTNMHKSRKKRKE